MTTATYTIFALGMAAQWLGAALALAYLIGANSGPLLRAATWTATLALILLSTAFVLRFAQWGVLPLSSGADSILLFTIMSSATAISVSCQARFRPLLSLYLPPLAALGGVCAALAVRDFAAPPKPIEVSQALLFLHVGLAFQAYALFFIASLTSVAYIVQSRMLKKRSTSALYLKLPSLEDLERTLHLLVKLGYPMFVITLLMGLAWARFVANTLSPTWWFSPKIALSFVMVIFYAASFHSRAFGWLRGPKLAYFVFVGFGLLLGVYLALEMLRLTNYNFWGQTAPMSLTVTGLSHHTSPLELRERMAFDPAQMAAALHRLKRVVNGGGAVIVSTCNRVEIYARAEDPPAQVHEAVRRFLSEWHHLPESEFIESLYEYHDREAVEHCFRVASGLDSLVVGENQILGQIHDAFLLAQAEQVTDKILSGLFQKAFKVAKEVKTKTSISEGKVSVASVAVDLAVQIFGSLNGKAVMVIGSGDTGELALKSLVANGVSNVVVVNRTYESARQLAETFNGEALALADIHDHLHRADIIVSSTAAPQPILGPSDFQRALRLRNKAPMFVIDIAVPRDIAPGVHDLDNVYLYNIDDLQQVCNENLEARRAEVDQCMRLVEQQVGQFMRWRQGLYAEPAIVSMTNEFNTIREKELERALAQLSHLNEHDRAAIDYMTKRIVNQILQRPLVQIKEEMSTEEGHRVLHIVRRLFGLEERAL